MGNFILSYTLFVREYFILKIFIFIESVVEIATELENILSGYYQSKVFPVQLPQNMNLI